MEAVAERNPVAEAIVALPGVLLEEVCSDSLVGTDYEELNRLEGALLMFGALGVELGAAVVEALVAAAKGSELPVVSMVSRRTSQHA